MILKLDELLVNMDVPLRSCLGPPYRSAGQFTLHDSLSRGTGQLLLSRHET